MATLEQRIIALAQAIGTDVKDIRTKNGDLTALNTSTKLSLVAAINELKGSIDAVGGAAAGINDAAGNGDTAVTWSADKIFDSIEAAKTAVRDSILVVLLLLWIRCKNWPMPWVMILRWLPQSLLIWPSACVLMQNKCSQPANVSKPEITSRLQLLPT